MAHDPLAWIENELAEWQAQGLGRYLSPHEGPQSATISVSGQPLVNFGSNDYLGLANDPRLVKAVREALRQQGVGAGASPLVTGYSTAHERLEKQIARFERTASALVFPSGYSANVGAVTALVGKDDAVFSDEKNHASLIDGCRLSRATVHVYPHCNAGALASMLREASWFRRRLIVTDGLFSMDGDLAPLVDLADLAERYDAMLLVDEAHATGVFGDRGRGASEYLDVEDGIHVRVGTLSKALGCAGGFVVGGEPLVEWLVNRARSYIFSTAMPPAIAAAASAAIDLVTEQPQRRRDLMARANKLRDQLHAAGWNIGKSQSQIIPIIVGDAEQTMNLAAALRRHGLLVPGIRPPSVPDGQSLLRISLCHGHTETMIAELTKALSVYR